MPDTRFVYINIGGLGMKKEDEVLTLPTRRCSCLSDVCDIGTGTETSSFSGRTGLRQGSREVDTKDR